MKKKKKKERRKLYVETWAETSASRVALESVTAIAQQMGNWGVCQTNSENQATFHLKTAECFQFDKF